MDSPSPRSVQEQALAPRLTMAHQEASALSSPQGSTTTITPSSAHKRRTATAAAGSLNYSLQNPPVKSTPPEHGKTSRTSIHNTTTKGKQQRPSSTPTTSTTRQGTKTKKEAPARTVTMETQTSEPQSTDEGEGEQVESLSQSSGPHSTSSSATSTSSTTSTSSSSEEEEEVITPVRNKQARRQSQPFVGPQSLNGSVNNNPIPPHGLPQILDSAEDVALKEDIRLLHDERRALLLQVKHMDHHLTTIHRTNTQRFQRVLDLLLGAQQQSQQASATATKPVLASSHAGVRGSTADLNTERSTPFPGTSPRSPLSGPESSAVFTNHPNQPQDNNGPRLVHQDPSGSFERHVSSTTEDHLASRQSAADEHQDGALPLVTPTAWNQRLAGPCAAFEELLHEEEELLKTREADALFHGTKAHHESLPVTPTERSHLQHSQQALFSPQANQTPRQRTNDPQQHGAGEEPHDEAAPAFADNVEAVTNDSDLVNRPRSDSELQTAAPTLEGLDAKGQLLLNELAELITQSIHEHTNAEAKRRKLRRLAIEDVRSTNLILEGQHQAASQKNFAAMRERHQSEERFRESLLLSVFDHLESLEDLIVLPFSGRVPLADEEEEEPARTKPSSLPSVWQWGGTPASSSLYGGDPNQEPSQSLSQDDVLFDAGHALSALRLFPLVAERDSVRVQRHTELWKMQLTEAREAHAYQTAAVEVDTATTDSSTPTQGSDTPPPPSSHLNKTRRNATDKTDAALAARKLAWMHRAADQFFPEAYVESLEKRANEIASKRREYLEMFGPLEDHCTRLHRQVGDLHRMSGKSPTRTSRSSSQVHSDRKPDVVTSAGGVPQRQRSASVVKANREGDPNEGGPLSARSNRGGTSPLVLHHPRASYVAVPTVFTSQNYNNNSRHHHSSASLSTPEGPFTTTTATNNKVNDSARGPRNSLSNVSSRMASPRVQGIASQQQQQQVMADASPSATELQMLSHPPPPRHSPIALDPQLLNKSGTTATTKPFPSPGRGVSPVSPRAVSPVRKNGMHHVSTLDSYVELQLVPRGSSVTNVGVNGGEQLASLRTLLDRKKKLQKQLADLQRVCKRELSAQLLAEEIERKRAKDRWLKLKRRNERLGA